MTVSNRLLSIDAFRGATVIAMLLTTPPSEPSATYSAFRHADWIGWTFADCIAPCFMWIVGVALSLSLSRRRLRGESRADMLYHIWRRAVFLFLIGALLVNLPVLVDTGWAGVSTFKIMGTLARISVAYLIAGILCVSLQSAFSQFISVCAILALYSVIACLVRVPGFALADFSPDGNAIGFLDRTILKAHSANSHPMISALSASATVLLGAMIGQLLNSGNSAIRTLRRMLLIGVFLLSAGKALTYLVPVVMYIWTPSYCLLMAGIATLLHGLLFWVMEIKRRCRNFTFLLAFGANSLLIWVGVGLLETSFSVKGFISNDGSWHSFWHFAYETIAGLFEKPQQGTLLFAFIIVCFWYCVAYVMYRRKWSFRF